MKKLFTLFLSTFFLLQLLTSCTYMDSSEQKNPERAYIYLSTKNFGEKLYETPKVTVSEPNGIKSFSNLINSAVVSKETVNYSTPKYIAVISYGFKKEIIYFDLCKINSEYSGFFVKRDDTETVYLLKDNYIQEFISEYESEFPQLK